jgi:hypothetical protein
MSGTIGAVLAAIAAVFATIGFIMFGKPKATETRDRTTTEQVVRPEPFNPDKPLFEPPIAVPIEPEPLPVGDATVDPWADEPATLTLDTVEQPEEGYAAIGSEGSDNVSDEAAMTYDPSDVIELNLDDATQVNEPVQSEFSVPTARHSSNVDKSAASPLSPSVQQVPFAAIQDPQRPSSPELQTLSQQILAWGNSGTAESLKTVMSYDKHPDALIRRYVAVAIGQVAAQGTIGSDIQSAVPVLEALSLDSDLKVQKMALKSLNSIQS